MSVSHLHLILNLFRSSVPPVSQAVMIPFPAIAFLIAALLQNNGVFPDVEKEYQRGKLLPQQLF